MRRHVAWLLFAAGLVACSEEAALPPPADEPCASCGGAAPEPEPAMCRGEALPRGSAAVDDEGRTAVVACDGYTLRVTAFAPAVARLRYLPEGEELPVRPSYALTAGPHQVADVAIGVRDERVTLCTDEVLVDVEPGSCRLRAFDRDGRLVSEDAPEGGFQRGGPLGATGRGLVRLAEDGERFYGFGERTGALDKRGRTLAFWNTDAFVADWNGYPPGADPLYQSIPFFIGLRQGTAYGVLLDNTHRLEFDMGSREADKYALWAGAGILDAYVVAGPMIRDVVQRYAALTGTTPRPPYWSLGYHQSRWGYYPDDAVLSVAEEFRARHIGGDGMWLDIQHLDGFRSFTWDPLGFADPSVLVDDLAALGFKTVVIVDPAIKVDDAWDVYAQGMNDGRFLRDGKGVYVGEVWPGAAVFPDFSDPAVRDWWASLTPRALDHGVRGLWIDMNEPSDFASASGTVPETLLAHGDGSATTMAEMHNVYALNEARATYQGMRVAAPQHRPFVLSRAGYAGIQRHAAVWTGDAPSTWGTLEETLPMLLGMGLSGVPFVGSDVGGYSGGASPELFARWMQLGSVSPFFRGHVMSGAQDQEPWRFGSEVEDISRSVIAARYELLPTWYSLFDEHARSGSPVLRPLVYEFQDDPATHAIGDQAMIGSWLMLAPILEEGATTRTVYLPAGRWFEARSGAIHEGPATIEIATTLGAFPTFVRHGAILAKGPRLEWSDQHPLDPLTLEIYPAAETTRMSFYEDGGDGFAYENGAFRRVTYEISPTATGSRLEARDREGSLRATERTLFVRVRRVDHGVEGVSLDGVALAEHASFDDLAESGLGYVYDDRDLSLVVAFPDADAFDLAMDYDPAIDDPRPPVDMMVVVDVPAATPTETPIHIATSANGWQHQALAWGPEANQAHAFISVPRGDYVFYKYTRGSWGSVEKWPGCVEASNRYEIGAAHPVKTDRVFAWADSCP